MQISFKQISRHHIFNHSQLSSVCTPLLVFFTNNSFRLASPAGPASPITSIIAALANGVAGASGGKVTPVQLQQGGVLDPAVTNFLNSQSYNSSKPKAFVNWLLLDEQLKYAGGGFEQVGDNEVFSTHIRNGLPVTKNGYLYVYVSNETPNIDVFFDNLQLTHVRGPLLEETHYYPFGLTMAGISSKKLGDINEGRLKNQYQYQGEYVEYDDETSWNDFELRSYDAQIGRFIQIDPYDQFASPYTGMGNDPVNLVDPSGGIAIPCPPLGPLSMLSGVMSQISTLTTILGVTSNALQIASTITTQQTVIDQGRQGPGLSSPGNPGSRLLPDISLKGFPPDNSLTGRTLRKAHEKDKLVKFRFNEDDQTVSNDNAIYLVEMVRFAESEDATVSTFTITRPDGEKLDGFFLEPGGPETVSRNIDKRIPKGTYSMRLTFSKRFKKRMYLISNSQVPADRGIRLHSGNEHTQTEGCLMPGKSYKLSNGNYIVEQSRKMYSQIMGFLNGHNTKLVIKN